MNRELLCLSVNHLCGHKLRFLPLLCVVGKEVGEEEHLQNGEHDEEFDGDDGPQRAAQSHLPEAIIIEVECVLKKSGHRRLRFSLTFVWGASSARAGPAVGGAALRSTAAKVGNNSEKPKLSVEIIVHVKHSLNPAIPFSLLLKRISGPMHWQ